jgi:phage terminase large subunit-like protein
MSTQAPTKRTRTSDPVTKYATAVVAGLTVAGPFVRAACARHLDDLKYGRGRGLVWDLEAAHRAINFFPDVLRLNGGDFEGTPFKLLPWECFIVGSLFGWKRRDGSRRFREAYVEAGKGSGKSPLAAGIGLYMLTSDGEASAEVYAAATRRDQAMVLFRDAVSMVRQSPALTSRIVITGRDDRAWNLAYRAASSFFRPIASDSTGQSGPRPHCGLIDEIHEHKDPAVINIMRAGKKGRRQPLIFMITNSGFDRNSICWEQHAYGMKVASRDTEDDAYFSYICALDEDEDPFEDESCWIKVNPSLGKTIQKTYLREQVHQARGMPSQESTVRRLNFCQWVDAENPWIDGDLWRACEVPDLPDEVFEGRAVHGGLDLSGVRDLSALAYVVRQDDDSVDAFVDFFIQQDGLHEHERMDNTHYVSWVDKGYMTATPGASINYSFIVQSLIERSMTLDVQGVCYDPYRIDHFKPYMDEENCQIELIHHAQGYARSSKSNLWMPHSIEVMEKLVVDGRLRVRFNPCLRWNSANAVLEADAKNNRIFTKRRSTGRIDGLVALAMAIGLAFNEEVEENLDDFINAPLTV